eukprot:c25906_g1_i2 orf=405-1679(+)
MGSGETGTPTKTTKTSTGQEQAPGSAPLSYPEWAAAFQAYYASGTTPLPPPGYFPTTVASGPQPHPYMWGAQPLVSHYGTPPPYAALFPHGAMYAHPSIPPGTNPYGPYSLAPGSGSDVPATVTPVGSEAEGKHGDSKEQSPLKRSKGSLGSLGMLTGKGSDTGKGTSGSLNGVVSHSGDSGSEGSSDGSEGNSQNDASNQAGNQNAAAIPFSVGGKQTAAAGPMTNLNIGMDYWSGASTKATGSTHGKYGSVAIPTTAMMPSAPIMGSGGDGVPPELWLQDERELKRQRRKQSNRESARRSRLRKQAECEELAARVETLTAENVTLRSELNRLSEQFKRLSAENSSLLEQLQSCKPQEEEEIRIAVEKEGARTKRVDHCDDGVGEMENDDSLRNARIEKTSGSTGKPYLTDDGKNHVTSASLA